VAHLRGAAAARELDLHHPVLQPRPARQVRERARRNPDARHPGADTAINFSQPSQQSLNPFQLLSTLESIFTALQTGAITNPTLRDEGLCLLEGFYTPFSNAALKALYPTHSAYVSAFTAAAARELAAGFLTQPDYNAAVAAAQASPVP
jgi:hypothetical protein